MFGHLQGGGRWVLWVWKNCANLNRKKKDQTKLWSSVNIRCRKHKYAFLCFLKVNVLVMSRWLSLVSSVNVNKFCPFLSFLQFFSAFRFDFFFSYVFMTTTWNPINIQEGGGWGNSGWVIPFYLLLIQYLQINIKRNKTERKKENGKTIFIVCPFFMLHWCLICKDHKKERTKRTIVYNPMCKILMYLCCVCFSDFPRPFVKMNWIYRKAFLYTLTLPPSKGIFR